MTGGLEDITGLQIAADAGYCAQADLAFAERVLNRFDLLIDGARAAARRSGMFRRDRFVVADDGSATRPAGRRMKGPTPHHHDGRTLWSGVGCGDCPLRSQCTEGETRSLTANLELAWLRAAMQARMDAPGGLDRYHRRIATVEPVFSNIESVMAYRHARSCREGTVVAEVTRGSRTTSADCWSPSGLRASTG